MWVNVGENGGKWGQNKCSCPSVGDFDPPYHQDTLMMFLGEYEHTIDDKGRLTIPAKFRDELEGYTFCYLEIDSHTAHAGFDTRVGAFLDIIEERHKRQV